MKRAVTVVVLLVVIVGVGLYATGCPRKSQAPPVTGPVGTGPMPPVAPGGPATPSAFTYVCPDHPDQKSDKPAKCPTCDKPMKADTTEPVEYFCPMHPDVVQSEPGVCEKCGGMVLQARPAGGVAPPTAGEKAEPAAPSTEGKDKPPSEPEKGEAGTT